MSGNEKNVPKRRFKEFENAEAWEQRKLGELGSVVMNRRIFKEQTSDEGDVPFYKIGTFGSQPDAFISRELFKEYKSKYPYPEKGDILISASGSIGRTVEYMGKDEYFQDSNIVWLQHDDQVINSFLKQFYSVVKWSGLEGSTIKRLYNKNILDTPISLPKPEEQKTIGHFFNQLDNLITIYQRKLEKMKALKKSYLTEMFPAEGERKPKLRFAGFTGDWEQRELGDISDVTKLAGFEFTEYVIYSDEGTIIALRGLNVKNGKIILDDVKYIDKSDFSKLNRSKLFKDDILFTYVGTVGELAIIPADNKYYLAPNVARIRLKKEINSQFVIQMMGNKTYYDKVIFPLIATSSQPALSMENVRKFILKLPSFEEQTKIGEFFVQLDTLITFHQRKLEKLQNIKKAYLNEMFI